MAEKKCGCGGPLEDGRGCLLYYDSEEQLEDEMHEAMMRRGGLGFGTALPIDVAVMSAHLQANGLSYEESEQTLLGWDKVDTK
jgi:hypothetical protein